MNKQEEIREGMINVALRELFWETREALVDALREYLHSQGVVIKVDRELPLTNVGEMLAEYKLAWKNNKGEWCYEIPIAYPPPTKEYPRTRVHIDGEYLGNRLKHELGAQKTLTEAGYVATEPLIKEE